MDVISRLLYVHQNMYSNSKKLLQDSFHVRTCSNTKAHGLVSSNPVNKT